MKISGISAANVNFDAKSKKAKQQDVQKTQETQQPQQVKRVLCNWGSDYPYYVTVAVNEKEPTARVRGIKKPEDKEHVQRCIKAGIPPYGC